MVDPTIAAHAATAKGNPPKTLELARGAEEQAREWKEHVRGAPAGDRRRAGAKHLSPVLEGEAATARALASTLRYVLRSTKSPA